MPIKSCYLLKIIDTIEPKVLPYKSEEERLSAAQGHRREDPEKNDALFKLDIFDGVPVVSTFSGKDLEEE